MQTPSYGSSSVLAQDGTTPLTYMLLDPHMEKTPQDQSQPLPVETYQEESTGGSTGESTVSHGDQG